MSGQARRDDQEWLERGAHRDPNGWEAEYIRVWGLQGALDLLACQGGRFHEVKLTRTPFRRNVFLKMLVVDARDHANAASTEAYRYAFEQLDLLKARRAAEAAAAEEAS